jgi:hypothetical protein
MKPPKPKQSIVVLGLYVLSLLLLLVSVFFRSTPALVFSLTYQPLNISTTAIVDEEDFLFFSELNQEIVLPSFPQGEYRLHVATSGGVVVDTLIDSGLSTITLVTGEQSMAIEMDDLIGEHQLSWRQPSSSSVVLTFTNFVKINSSILYGVYIEDIRVYKI